MIKINVVKEFTDAPGGRTHDDGPFSGQEFLELLLLPRFIECIDKNEKLLIELDIQNKFMDIHFCEDLKQTVILANRYSKPGQVVLFSPASASFDMFKNFMERGIKFKEIVNKI